jgi:hypothetical protein
MNRFKILIKASPETNDHQACILIDGSDWLGNGYMGLDPPRLFRQEFLLRGGRVLVGRCDCGCEGCGDVMVGVIIEGDIVMWQAPNGDQLVFDRAQYESEIMAIRNDHSWEDNNRTAERLVDAVFNSTVIKDGSTFEWSSARIEKGKIKLSFSSKGQQKLIEFDWDPEDPTTAEERARQLKQKLVNHCDYQPH